MNTVLNRSLKENEYYTCALSGRKVKVERLYIDSSTNLSGETQETVTAVAAVYNKVTGDIQFYDIPERTLIPNRI